MGQSNAAFTRFWQEWVDKGRFQLHGCSGRPRASVDWEDRLNRRIPLPIVFIENVSGNAHKADLAFPIAYHIGPQPRVIVWGAISLDRRTPLRVIRDTLTAQGYVEDIMRTVLLPLILLYPRLTSLQDSARPHTELLL
ncbi:transposable element Tc1 transposase [Trichonephila clavipes]|uniref:Transposable element Tc1 transposase n=1 Tax=Trichonephila clavipes TaxID=2585209 RepID=A0A8X6VPF3_TRICX|nr:transposable element Tc1 transposase [Trichonephila clavipes]